MKFRFVHAGDFHLGYPFERLAGITPADAEQLHRQHTAAFDRLIRGVCKIKADFLLIAGDVFDRNHHCMQSRRHFLKAMHLLQSEGIRVWIVAGNHDPLSEWEIASELPSNVRLFGAVPEKEEIILDGTVAATIAGVSHADRNVTTNLAMEAARLLNNLSGFRIGLVHANVGTQPYAAPVTLEELTGSGVHYWALGHMHARSLLSGNPPVLYCGSIFRLAREENPHYGINLVTVKDNHPSLELLSPD